MYNKRSALFLTELLLLFLISQLFWPIQGYIHAPIVLQVTHILFDVATGICLLVLPGRWRSYLFFDDGQIGGGERFVVSFAISLAVIVFSTAYLKWGGVALYPWKILLFIVLWLFFGIVIVFSRNKGKGSRYI